MLKAMTVGSDHFRVEEVAPGAWAAIAGTTGACASNAGIIDLGDQTLVVDTFLTPAAGHELSRVARQLTGREASLVVNTHHHEDHIGGNGAFPTADIVSTPETAVRIRKSTPDARLPNRPFAGELVVEGSERSAHIITYGGGHTDSDSFVFLPDCGALFAGDLLWVENHPWAGDGHPDEWIDIIFRMKALDPQTVIPGHGTVSAFAYARIFIRYLTLVCDTVRQAEASSTSVVKLADTAIPPQYGAWSTPKHFRDSLRALGTRAGLQPD